MIGRAEAVAAALAWVGTPYVRGARVRGAGCDCETLIEAYLLEIGAASEIETGLYSNDWFRNTGVEIYFRELSKFATCVWEGRCVGVPPAQPGDIAIFRVVKSKVYNHGCIITGWPKALHALGKGVAESRPGMHPLTSHHEMAIFSPWVKTGM